VGTVCKTALSVYEIFTTYPSNRVIGAKYDTMDPKHMEWMSHEVQNGRFLFCPNGSHLSQYDDQKNYFKGVIQFLRDVDGGDFKKE
jgi:proline iminopeptidase